MPRQVSDEEYNFLQARRQVADFVESIYNDPQLNREAKALIKRKYPNLQIPDYDIETRVEQRLDTDRREREEAESAKRAAEEDARFKKLREDTQKQYGFTDEAMSKLEQMMVDRNIGDYEAAALLMAQRNPPSIEPTFGDNRWNHTQKAEFAEISKDPEGWARNEIIGAMRRDQDNARGGR